VLLHRKWKKWLTIETALSWRPCDLYVTDHRTADLHGIWTNLTIVRLFDIFGWELFHWISTRSGSHQNSFFWAAFSAGLMTEWRSDVDCCVVSSVSTFSGSSVWSAQRRFRMDACDVFGSTLAFVEITSSTFKLYEPTEAIMHRWSDPFHSFSDLFLCSCTIYHCWTGLNRIADQVCALDKPLMNIFGHEMSDRQCLIDITFKYCLSGYPIVFTSSLQKWLHTRHRRWINFDGDRFVR